MGRAMGRVAGVVFAGALVTFAAAPAALAQTDTTDPAPSTTTETSTAETTTTTAPPSSATTTSSTPVTTTGITGPVSVHPVPEAAKAPNSEKPTSTSAAGEPPKDDYQDNVGHGFVGLGGEGVLVIACASGKIGPVSTQYLSVTGGPDQDESDGRYWNYSVRVVDAPAGTTTAKFSWTCDGVEGNGIVEFQQDEPPTTTTSATTTSTSAPASSTAPIVTATSSAPAGNAAPKAQVKVAPKGGVETGFGGTAW